MRIAHYCFFALIVISSDSMHIPSFALILNFKSANDALFTPEHAPICSDFYSLFNVELKL